VNGVPLGEVMRAFGRTGAEIAADIRYAGNKIASYCIARCQPVRDFADVGVIRAHGSLVHHYLDRVDLDVLPRFKNIRVESFDARKLKGLRR
jgi:hypothetical protein